MPKRRKYHPYGNYSPYTQRGGEYNHPSRESADLASSEWQRSLNKMHWTVVIKIPALYGEREIERFAYVPSGGYPSPVWDGDKWIPGVAADWAGAGGGGTVSVPISVVREQLLSGAATAEPSSVTIHQPLPDRKSRMSYGPFENIAEAQGYIGSHSDVMTGAIIIVPDPTFDIEKLIWPGE